MILRTRILCLLLSGCTTLQPGAPAPQPVKAPFSHAELDGVFSRFVDAEGRVDYAGLARDDGQLQRYYARVAACSPASHAEVFADEESRLAYWINAYNAAVLVAVLHHYPLASVSQVEPPFPLFFMPARSGFFYFQRLLFGGEKISLYDLEHEVIRARFAEPRVHFALNCASLGCPRLPQQAFGAGSLDEELERETRRFLAEERNVRIDHEQRTIYLSALFDWYREDFLQWLRREHAEREATLLNYVALYVPGEKRAELERVSGEYALRFSAYDWSLNDQAGPRR